MSEPTSSPHPVGFRSRDGLAVPLPPPPFVATPRVWPTRATAGVVALGTGALLGVAAWLEPASEGLGTHTALGLPRCGWVAAADFPCPTCGMTTAFAYAADGRLVTAFLTQPAGAALALLTAMALVASLHALVTGQSVVPLVRPLVRPRGWTIFGLFVLAAWIFKIVSHRGLL